MVPDALTFTPTTESPLRANPRATTETRKSFLQLQALVAIVLSYQLLFQGQHYLIGEAQLLGILGLLLTCLIIMVVPEPFIISSWFPGILALGDTALTTGLIYLSGHASPDLYFVYFFIIMIATMSKTDRQLFVWITTICVFYGVALYLDVLNTGRMEEHHLLRIPLFLVMATFYGRTAAAARSLAEIDPLTNLPNRRKFLGYVSRAIERAEPAHRALGLLCINLDGFKRLNETLGRRKGDKLIEAVAKRLIQGPGKECKVARESGDQFTLLMHRQATPEATDRLAQNILEDMAAPFMIQGREIYLTSSIGIAKFPQDGNTPEQLVKNAESAMLRAKDQGKNGYEFYVPGMRNQVFQRFELEHRLRKALQENELAVHYQAKVELVTQQIVGAEALARWTPPGMDMVHPGEFIGIAEETGLIVPIGQWIVKEACRQGHRWNTNSQRHVTVSVNLSARQFHQKDLVKQIGHTLKQSGLDPACLEMELTESLLMHNTDQTLAVLREFKDLGLQISLDDFGTGYSSLSYLSRFPIDTLKIDKSFVQDMSTNPNARSLVKAMIAMALALQLKVVAEGVETEEQMTLLREDGCHVGQGYLFSKPMPGDEFFTFFQQWERNAAPQPALRPA